MAADPRVDAYIAAAAPFARPVLIHLRSLVHAAAPGVDEAIKWSMPMFLHGGKIVANMAAFKAHAAFGTWRRDAVGGQEAVADGMGRLGKLTGLDCLPADEEIIALVRAAVAQVDAGGSIRTHRESKPMPEVPDDLRAALDLLPAAAAGFAALTPSGRRDYIGWVTEAKTAATRGKRIAMTVEWSAEGRRRP